ncbi:ABC transporter ATP-binding protein [Variovorax sp. KK3]|uniref:ABC transporter ATP-binding protein n=1 Tax=Variovorax sp. KK3 TaxID=1855728 RepID=UPI0009FAB420|nr:oligopeptide/dipeptide ABC transporter ATP-binding protein [Variovorax sp. KK3]
MSATFMQVEGLRKTYQVRRGLFGRPKPLHAVAGVSFDVQPGTTFGLVGESGSGKSTIAKMLMLAESPTEGTIRIGDHAVTEMKKQDQARFHRELQPVLQDPYSSLNPRMRIGRIIDEPLRIHEVTEFGPHKQRVAELLALVGLPPEAAGRYAHELSGGQRQRVSIARSLALSPKCMILDEPVSALDVSIQAQILNLLKDLQARLQLTYLLISHDLAVVAYLSQRIGVLYLGEFMEIGNAEDVMTRPRHPYTQALIASVGARSGGASANLVQGEIPSPMNPPSGCLFNPRCPHATERCRTEKPLLRDFGNGQKAACHHAETITFRSFAAGAAADPAIHQPHGANH